MDYHPSFEEDYSPHQHRKKRGKGKLFSYWGGDFGTEVERDYASPETLPSSAYPLSQAQAGYSVWIVGFRQQGGVKKLLGMGLAPGMRLKVINAHHSGSVIVAAGNQRTGLGAGMADKILVSDRPLNQNNEQEDTMSTQSRCYLRQMPVGTVAKVLGYEKTMGGYKGKLLSMGLTPKTEFTIIRVAPLGDPVEIQVRGFHLSLRKQEADALIVEVVKQGNS
jgi:ferrous iron transport protein A